MEDWTAPQVQRKEQQHESDTALSILEILGTILNQCQRVPSPLLNLELTIRLADDPAVVELATWANSIEQWQEVPLWLNLASTVVAEWIDAAVLHGVRDA